MHNVMAVTNVATLHRTAPTRFLPQKHHATKTDLVQVNDIPGPQGTDHTHPIMVSDMGDISPGHNSTPIPTAAGTVVSEGTHHAPYPATTAAHTNLWLIDASIAICSMPHPTGIVRPVVFSFLFSVAK